MALNIDTFQHGKGGETLFKALSHPYVQPALHLFIKKLEQAKNLYFYDPHGYLEAFGALHDLSHLDVKGLFVQSLAQRHQTFLTHKAKPVTCLETLEDMTLCVLDFDQKGLVSLAPFLKKSHKVLDLQDIRLPDVFLSNPEHYLHPHNFATNYAFFRAQGGLHTKLITTNYWTPYSGQPLRMWGTLFDENGHTLLTFEKTYDHGGSSIVIDSQKLQKDHGLPDFTGQLFLHFSGIKTHNIVKYALDIYDQKGQILSCTHDANAWPSNYYAGVPLGHDQEEVILWIQNSYPTPIPSGSLFFNPMGKESQKQTLEKTVPGFGSMAVSLSKLFPGATYPTQIEIFAGKHFVRPRYEVIRHAKRRIAHANVERDDVRPDPTLKELSSLWGKGHVVVGPILPPQYWRSKMLPTPMARHETVLPLKGIVYDASGKVVKTHSFGALTRDGCPSYDMSSAFMEMSLHQSWEDTLPSFDQESYGHMEIMIDFDLPESDQANGWLHSHFFYETSCHQAETIFGAHVYNTPLTYKDQPFSYKGPPPGLSTKLFLRLGSQGLESFCHLIYTASQTWQPYSDTSFSLYEGNGHLVARTKKEIPCQGSLLVMVKDLFDKESLAQATETGYVIIQDKTCRLFGYHGLLGTHGAFSLDHMFGF